MEINNKKRLVTIAQLAAACYSAANVLNEYPELSEFRDLLYNKGMEYDKEKEKLIGE